MSDLQRDRVGNVPVAWLEPKGYRGSRTLVIWIPGFSGSKEDMEPYLTDLTSVGFLALSFDPHQHGERMVDPSREVFGNRVRGNLRRYFWPILAETAKDASTVVDWAVKHLGVREVAGMGGISAGGDASVVASRINRDIAVIATGLATADWLRPGSFEPPGKADAKAQDYYDQYNPLTNLESYRHTPAINFQVGAIDEQCPPDGARRFVEALRNDIYKDCPERLEVESHQGITHEFTDEEWQNCLDWFLKYLK
jgi:hypothetical protein